MQICASHFHTKTRKVFACDYPYVHTSVLELKLAYCLFSGMGGSIKYPYLPKGR